MDERPTKQQNGNHQSQSQQQQNRVRFQEPDKDDDDDGENNQVRSDPKKPEDFFSCWADL